jgi:hypothetical protein
VRAALYARPWLPLAALAAYLTRRFMRWRRRRSAAHQAARPA